MEYDYAIEIGKPVLGFVKSDPENTPAKFAEDSAAGRKKLDTFRTKVTSRSCRMYSSPTELGMAVMKSLMSEFRINPQTGWVRADEARTQDDLEREKDLIRDLEKANNLVFQLERELRDRAVLGDEIDPKQLAQGDDKLSFQVTFRTGNRQIKTDTVDFTWDELFLIIAVHLYGYVVRKPRNDHREEKTYLFHEDIVEAIRHKILEKVQGRKINLPAIQVDQAILHLKELGLLMFDQNGDEDKFFRRITLTEVGEKHMARLSVQMRTER